MRQHQRVLEGLHTGQKKKKKKIVILMMIPVKNNSNDDFLARVYANYNHEC